MKNARLILGLITLTLFCSCQEFNREPDLKALLEAYQQAVNSKDAGKFLSCFASDYTDRFFPPETAQKNIRESLSGKLAPVLEITEQKISRLKRTEAKVEQGFILQGMIFAKPRKYQEKETLTLRWNSERWEIVSGSRVYQILAGAPKEEDEILKLMEKRIQALKEKNPGLFSQIIAPDYNFSGKNRERVLKEMAENFKIYKKIELELKNPRIQLLSGRAILIEDYQLRAWHQDRILEFQDKEKLELKKTPEGWKISKGI